MAKVIDVSDLKKNNGKKIEKLADFLRAKLNLEPVIEKNNITLSSNLSGKKTRFFVKKFLHKNEMKAYRIISQEGGWKIKKQKKSLATQI